MRIQIFQHLPALPKAGIFRPLPILCVAFRAFIPDRSAFRCSLSPVFLCSVPSSRCINPHTLSRTPPLPRATLLPHPTTTPAASQRNPLHTYTRRPTSHTGHRTPAPGTAHPPPTLYSHHSHTPILTADRRIRPRHHHTATPTPYTGIKKGLPRTGAVLFVVFCQIMA